MPVRKYSNEEIINILRNLSRTLGRKRISSKEVAGVISVHVVRYWFGSVGKALEAAGLEQARHFSTANSLSEDELFHALYETEMRIGHEPDSVDCMNKGRHSVACYRVRYGNWSDVLVQYRAWKEKNGQKLSEIIEKKPADDGRGGNGIENGRPAVKSPVAGMSKDKKPAPAELYGEPLDFRGLRHAPTNEQGVVFLFAMVSRELGFNVESVRQAFPDCEAKYLFDPKKNLWARARLEFEYRASLFKDHNHDPQKCEFIVCWINDWPDCPLNVIELKTEIMKLPNI